MNKPLFKHHGIIITLFVCMLMTLNAKAQTVIYSTDFGTVANVNPANWTFTGLGMNISTNTPSSGYAGVSGGAYLGEGNSMTFTNTAGSSMASSPTGTSTAVLQISTLTYSNINVSFGMRKSGTGYNTNATYSFEWSTNNVTYTPIAYTEATAGGWGLATGSGLNLPAGANNQATLYLRFTFNRTGTASNYKIDDVKITSVIASDVTPPTVSNAYLLNGSTVKVKFSEPVTAASATATTHYTFTPAATISSITLNTTGDTATLNLSAPLPIGVSHTLAINGISDIALNTMTVAQNFPLLNTGIIAKVYTWKHPQTIGTYQGLNIPNGGFSGLNYIKGTTNEFYVITDRGPNLDANNNNHALSMGGANNTAKLFALPAFNPNVMRFKAQGDSLIYLSSFTVKRPNNTSTSGLINPPQTGGTGEIALSDTNGTVVSPDIWGIDSEGFTDGNNNDFWIPEEYGVSIWHTDANGKVINRYAPYGGLPGAQPEDVAIDTIFKFRNPNKGFEGVAFTPNKKVYGFIQNTILFPASDVNLKKNTRLHRFVEIDTRTNTTRMLGYEHDAVPASGALSSIKNDKRYIGDAVAVNDHEVLILEHGKSSTESYGKIYLVNITPATPINPTQHMIYASGTKSFEQLLDSTTAAANGVTVVKKTLLIDLIANGYDPTIEKEEGLTIINDTCIAIANDNDFGLISNNSDGVASYNNVKSYIYTFSFPRSRKLNLCGNTTIASSTLSACSGDSIQLSMTASAGTNYQWKNNSTIIPAAAGASSYYAKTAGSYELYTTNANGCVSISNTKVLTFTASPTLTVSPTATVVCAGQPVTITASGANTYSFTGGISNGVAFTPASSTTYSITGTNTLTTCKATVSQAITVNPLPTVSASSSNSLICTGSSVNLTGSGAVSYTWNPGNMTGTTVSVSPTATTVYTVTGKNANGCNNTSNITQSVSNCTSIEDLAANEPALLSVFPNPNNGEFTIKTSADLMLSIINQLGEELKVISLNASNNYQANVNGLPNGIYYLMNRSAKNVLPQKIVVAQ